MATKHAEIRLATLGLARAGVVIARVWSDPRALVKPSPRQASLNSCRHQVREKDGWMEASRAVRCETTDRKYHVPLQKTCASYWPACSPALNRSNYCLRTAVAITGASLALGHSQLVRVLCGRRSFTSRSPKSPWAPFCPNTFTLALLSAFSQPYNNVPARSLHRRLSSPDSVARFYTSINFRPLAARALTLPSPALDSGRLPSSTLICSTVRLACHEVRLCPWGFGSLKCNLDWRWSHPA